MALALGIAIMPPIWAVIAPHIGITTGSVALICAGLFVANGNNRANVKKIIIGFLMGDLWAVLAIWIMETMQFNPELELYGTLFCLGGVAVLIGENLYKWIFTPSLLCGWAISLTLMGALSPMELKSLPIQIGVAMIVGVLYVGVGVDEFQKFLIRRLTK